MSCYRHRPVRTQMKYMTSDRSPYQSWFLHEIGLKKKPGTADEQPDKNESDKAPVVQRLDSAIHRINHYPVDKY